ncbi:hypothetical protein [Pedobacter arcticus]|uniref:hypothetical protein n=1 Tax=Pedobacter arcticus TaxID=752140 RepID=UPI0002EDE3B4|nr:hypothetical protein [Pedobacter arcticus]
MIKVVPYQGSTMTILSYFEFSQGSLIVNWLNENFRDLDALDLEMGIQNFLKDETYGLLEDGLKAKLKTAKELALAYNIWGGVFGFILLFFKQQFAYVALLIFPLLGIVLLYCFDLIKFLSNNKRSIYPQILIGFALPCTMLLIKTTDFNLLNYDELWIPLIVFCSLVFFLLYFRGINRSVPSVLGQSVIMLIVVIVYGFGCIRTVNCVLDKSEQSLFKVAVLDKHVTRGKSTSHYLQLNKWGPQQKINNEKVSRRMFNNIYTGDFVTVRLKQGYLHAPWYIVLRND